MGIVIRDRPNRGKADITVDVLLPLALTAAQRELLVVRVTETVVDALPIMTTGRVRVNITMPKKKGKP